MNYLAILPHYFIWHYGRALSDIFAILKNLLLFVYNFFSVRALFFSLFSPWKRLGETYQKNANLEDVAGAIVVNTMMRILGAVIRLIFIIIGIVFMIAGLILGIAFFVFWIFLPAIILYLLLSNLVELLK